MMIENNHRELNGRPIQHNRKRALLQPWSGAKCANKNLTHQQQEFLLHSEIGLHFRVNVLSTETKYLDENNIWEKHHLWFFVIFWDWTQQRILCIWKFWCDEKSPKRKFAEV